MAGVSGSDKKPPSINVTKKFRPRHGAIPHHKTVQHAQINLRSVTQELCRSLCQVSQVFRSLMNVARKLKWNGEGKREF